MNRLLLTIALVISGCGYSNTSVPDSPSSQPPSGGDASGDGGANKVSELNFANIKTQVLQVYCLRCHSNAGGNRGRINLETYASVKSLIPQITSAVNSGQMPPSGGGIARASLSLLNRWIQAGAPELTAANENPGGPGGTPPAPPLPPTRTEPIPCEDLTRKVALRTAVPLDSYFYFDQEQQEILRRHDDCDAFDQLN